MDGRAVERDTGSKQGRRNQTPDTPLRAEPSPMQRATADWVLPGAGSVQVALVAAHESGQSLGEYLHGAGMSVRAWDTPAAFEASSGSSTADIVVVDASAFGADAYSLLTRLRVKAVGLVMMVAKGNRADRLLALSLGADHCMSSPPDPHELELRLRNLHRRLRQARIVDVPLQGHPGAAGALQTWVFDATEWTLTAPNGRAASLSMINHHVLRRLLREPGLVVSREDLLGELERHRVKLGSRNLDMVVSRLRKKVENDCGEYLPVRSARTIGYVFTGKCQIIGGRRPDSRSTS